MKSFISHLLVSMSLLSLPMVVTAGDKACFQHKTLFGCFTDPCCHISRGGSNYWSCNQSADNLLCRTKTPNKKQDESETTVSIEKNSQVCAECMAEPKTPANEESIVTAAADTKKIIDLNIQGERDKTDLDQLSGKGASLQIKNQILLKEAAVLYPSVKPIFVSHGITYLNPEQSREELKALADYLIRHPELKIRLIGSTNFNNFSKAQHKVETKRVLDRIEQLKDRLALTKGQARAIKKNEKEFSTHLSLGRALTVADSLLELGVPRSQIKSIDGSIPGSRMVVPANSEDRYKNLRVDIEFEIADDSKEKFSDLGKK